MKNLPLLDRRLVLLAAPQLVLHARGDVDQVPAERTPELLPENIGRWTGTGHAPSTTTSSPSSAKATSSIASTLTPAGCRPATAPSSRRPLHRLLPHPAHRPVDPLPAALPARRRLDLRVVQLHQPHRRNGKNYHVGEYVISNGEVTPVRPLLVPGAWPQHRQRLRRQGLHDRRRHPLQPNRRCPGPRHVPRSCPAETADDARERAIGFASKMAPMLPEFIPN